MSYEEKIDDVIEVFDMLLSRNRLPFKPEKLVDIALEIVLSEPHQEIISEEDYLNNCQSELRWKESQLHVVANENKEFRKVIKRLEQQKLDLEEIIKEGNKILVDENESLREQVKDLKETLKYENIE